jgi:hypothetical protein
LAVLLRKVRVSEEQEGNYASNHGKSEHSNYREIVITIEKGINFHYLYNGIKPNVFIKFPQLSYESKVKTRTSDPVFN